jgi:hypothetical protein
MDANNSMEHKNADTTTDRPSDVDECGCVREENGECGCLRDSLRKQATGLPG